MKMRLTTSKIRAILQGYDILCGLWEVARIIAKSNPPSTLLLRMMLF